MNSPRRRPSGVSSGPSSSQGAMPQTVRPNASRRETSLRFASRESDSKGRSRLSVPSDRRVTTGRAMRSRLATQNCRSGLSETTVRTSTTGRPSSRRL